jgi:hypothetical protein
VYNRVADVRVVSDEDEVAGFYSVIMRRTRLRRDEVGVPVPRRAEFTEDRRDVLLD